MNKKVQRFHPVKVLGIDSYDIEVLQIKELWGSKDGTDVDFAIGQTHVEHRGVRWVFTDAESLENERAIESGAYVDYSVLC